VNRQIDLYRESGCTAGRMCTYACVILGIMSCVCTCACVILGILSCYGKNVELVQNADDGTRRVGRTNDDVVNNDTNDIFLRTYFHFVMIFMLMCSC